MKIVVDCRSLVALVGMLGVLLAFSDARAESERQQANRILVEVSQLFDKARDDNSDLLPDERRTAIGEADKLLRSIIAKFPSTDLAVTLASRGSVGVISLETPARELWLLERKLRGEADVTSGQLNICESIGLLKTALADLRTNPLLLRCASLAASNLFVYQCASCHGGGAQGTPSGPNIIDGNWTHGGKIGDIYNSIRIGFGSSHSFEGSLREGALKSLALYVHSLGGGK